MSNPYVVAQDDGLSHNWAEGSNELTDAKNLFDDITKGDPLGGVFDAGSAALDVLGDIGDPLGAVISCAVGWIVDHVSFLRDPVDWLAGDPHSIEAATKTYANVGAGMKQAAQAYADAAGGLGAQQWSGPAADAYRKKAADWVETLDGAGSAAQLQSMLISATGGLCAAVRAELFDLVSEAIERWVMVGLVALANSAWTFGASIAGWVVDVEIEAGLLAARMTAKIADLIGRVGRVAERLGSTGSKLAAVGQKLVALSERMVHNVHSARGFLSADRRWANAGGRDGDLVHDGMHLYDSVHRADGLLHLGTAGKVLSVTKDGLEVAHDPSTAHLDDLAGNAAKTATKTGLDAAHDSAEGR